MKNTAEDRERGRWAAAGLSMLGCVLGWSLGFILAALINLIYGLEAILPFLLAVLLLASCPGAMVGLFTGGPSLVLRSVIGSVAGLVAGGLLVSLGNSVGAVVIENAVAPGGISLGSPVGFTAAGLAAGTIWGAVVGGSSLSVRTGLVGMGSGLVGHLLAILLSTPVNRILNFWPEGTDPAAFIFGVWIMATVLATVIGSAAAGALYRRPNVSRGRAGPKL